MDSVHGTVDHAGPVHRGPVAIVACPISSELNLRPLRLPGLSYEGRRRERGARGSRFRAHQGSEGDGVAACRWSRWWWGELRCGLLEAQKWGKEEVGGGDAGAPFYNLGGGAGRPSVGGEWVAAVVRHNGGGNHFGRGSTRVVVGSDEGVLWPLRERKGRREVARPHARQWRRLWPSIWGGRRPGGARMLATGGGWLAGLADRLKPNGGVGKVAHREGRGGENQANSRKKILFKFLLNFGFGRTFENCIGSFDGICTRGFFLKSSRFYRDFRKMNICHAMICNLSKII
jgi:hypothetical protein